MRQILWRWRAEIQTVLLAAATFAVFIYLYGIGYNIVMRNYFLGGTAFMHGYDPYAVTLQNGASNQFKYSPFFAVLMAGLENFAHTYSFSLALGGWVFLNTLVFCFGLSRWSFLFGIPNAYVLVAMLACFVDLMTSLQVYQASALVIGLTLIGLADYRDGKFLRAGIWLVLATNLKVFPFIFLVALLTRFKPRFIFGAFVTSAWLFAIPSFYVDRDHNWAMHLKWLQVVLHEPVNYVILDLPEAFNRVGLPVLGQALNWFVLPMSLILFFAYLPLHKKIDWRPWITLGLSALIILNPRTEVFTYVILAPCYLLLTQWCYGSQRPPMRLWGTLAITLLSAAIASCRYTDRRWFHSEEPFEIIRVLGALGLWSFSAWIILRTSIVPIREWLVDASVARQKKARTNPR